MTHIVMLVVSVSLWGGRTRCRERLACRETNRLWIMKIGPWKMVIVVFFVIHDVEYKSVG